ncbi:MAG: CHASE domain-containing protein, partial [Balneolaceae bacterium]
MNNEQRIIQRIPPVLSGLIIGLIIMVIGVFVIYTQFQVQEKSRQAETREVLEVIERSFQYGIREVNSIALLLSESVNENGNVVDFNKSATELIERYQLANVLELITNGIVTHVYPLEGYEEILGYDLYQNERIKLELYKAAENNDIYFSGPTNLIEGELGIIGLLPFDQDGEDLKISAVIVYLNTFLDQTELSTFSDRYYFELSKKNLETGVEEFFLKPEHDHQIDWSQEQFLMIPEGDWKLYAHQITTTHFPLYIIFLSLFTIIISISIGYLSFKQFQRPIELEALLQERTQELYESKEQFKTSSELLGSVLASPQNIIIYSLDKDFNYI